MERLVASCEAIFDERAKDRVLLAVEEGANMTKTIHSTPGELHWLGVM